ncbi:MAG: hypothetical protein IJM49_00355 [Firmicutes bacterium]|jgi:hypothetical protein|nr:hypothetical protein [Bacillota bacterium]
MLELIFAVLMISVFGRLFVFGLRATWGFAKLIAAMVFLPIVLAIGLIGGLLQIAFPVLAVVGLVSLIRPRQIQQQ